MRRRLGSALAFAALISAPGAHAVLLEQSTQEFFDRCSIDDRVCVSRVEQIRQAYEKSGGKLCPPAAITRETYAENVTLWIGQQEKLDMNQNDMKSITAALKALYSCNAKPHGAKP